MEVQFKNLLHAYSGKCDGLVYYYNRRLNKVIARRLPNRKPHAGNAQLSSISRNLKALAPGEGYITDLKIYTELLRLKSGAAGMAIYAWSNTFRKLMYSLAAKYQVDLATITRSEIFTRNLPCITVRAAIEDGLLDVVQGYERFTAEM